MRRRKRNVASDVHIVLLIVGTGDIGNCANCDHSLPPPPRLIHLNGTRTNWLLRLLWTFFDWDTSQWDGVVLTLLQNEGTQNGKNERNKMGRDEMGVNSRIGRRHATMKNKAAGEAAMNTAPQAAR
jgi:hypothetical protein